MSYRGGVLEAIKSLQSYASFGLRDNDYDTLEWFDDPAVVPIPTREEVEAEHERLQAEYEAKEYQRQRAAEYPSFADQFDLLYHGGYDAWKAAIDAVKTKYPKE
jgi:rhodanese-related sulfurtransferase